MASLKEYRDARLNKLDQLRKLGIDPYPAKSSRTVNNDEIAKDFNKYESEPVTVAGRILSFREHGQLAFIDIKDASGKIQLYVKSDELSPADYSNSELNFADLVLLDPGDFLEAEGVVTKTKAGEVSVQVVHLRILTKSLRPLPNQWAGLKDKETRLRRRYLDTNLNQEVYDRFVRRSKFWQATRDFLNQHGFIEINVPVLEHTTGGADANPFVTHMDALNQDFYLRISQELPLKRLLGGGYEKVYDIGPRFRNENYSDEHLPEHIAMEWYWAYADWNDGMNLTQEMVRFVADGTWGRRKFSLMNGQEVDLGQNGVDWPRISFVQVMKDKYGIDVFEVGIEEIKEQLKIHKLEVEKQENRIRGIDKLWKKLRVELPGPAFLVDVPLFLQPLAKPHKTDPRLSEQFNLIIGGTEAVKAYSELNDALDQLNRFVEQQALRDAGDAEAQMLDIDFVEMLEYGMPPACGLGYTERLFWILEGVTAREGVPFPQLRHEIDDVTKTTYPEIFKIGKGSATKRGQDFGRRFVVVVDGSLEPWQVANAASHSIGYLSNRLPREQFVSGETFETKDGLELPRNSQYAMITKKAKSKELHKLLAALKNEPTVLYHVFVADMQETTDDAELVQRLGKQSNEELRIYAIALFGENETVNRLTKAFQLYS